MKLLDGIGLVLTSPKGYFYVCSDHITSSNSSDDVRGGAAAQYYLDQEKRLMDKDVPLSITAVECCPV